MVTRDYTSCGSRAMPRNCKCCGREASLSKIGIGKSFYVSCHNIECFAAGPQKPTEEAAIEAWDHLHAAVSLSIRFDGDHDPKQI